jgi:O-antigen/teichoic acid export membrane protein
MSLNSDISTSEHNTKKRLKFLFKDTFLYGGAAAFNKALSLITFPILARHFSVLEFGVLDYFMSLAGLLVTFLIFGQDSAVARFFYHYEDSETRRQLISQSLFFQLFGVIIILPLLWITSDWVCNIIDVSSQGADLFKIVIFQMPFILLINFSVNLLKWTFDRGPFLIMAVGNSIFQVCALLLAVFVFDVSIKVVLLVTLITSAIFGLLGLFFIRKFLILPTNYKYLREMIPFALPNGAICVLGAFSPALERTISAEILGVESLGLYATGAKVAMVMGFFVNAFQTAWGPFALSIHKEANAERIYNWVFKLFTFMMCLTALILTLLSKPLILFLTTDRYLGAWIVVFPLAMGLGIQGVSWITEIGIGISMRPKLSLYAYAIAIVATLFGIYLLTPFYGLLGVGLGVLIGHTVKSLIASILAQRVHPLSWQYRPVLALVATSIFGGFASIYISNHFELMLGNLLICVIISLVFLVGWRSLFSKEDRGRLKEILVRSRCRK